MKQSGEVGRKRGAAPAGILASVLWILVTACGGDDRGTGPNPTPVVTTVEVTPGTAAIDTAETLQLGVTVKDQGGAPITGKTVAWSSGAESIAVVSADGLVTGVAVGEVTITADVEGKQGRAHVTVTEDGIVLETGAAVTARIGSLGGTLTTSANGTTYTLEIPAASLPDTTEIVMTPVRALRGLPAEGDFVAGVKFEPSGLAFPRTATLKVHHQVTPNLAKVLVGYLADDSGSLVSLTPVGLTGDSLTILVPHFTIAGWGQFTRPLLVQFAPNLPSNSGEQAFATRLALLPDDAPLADVVAILEEWYTTLVEPELVTVLSNSTDQNIQAANDFRNWDGSARAFDNLFFHLGDALVQALAPIRDRGIVLLRPVLNIAIGFRASECDIASRLDPLKIAEQVFALQDIAEQFGLATPAIGLDNPSILTLLEQCARVINTQADFPANPTPNVSARLDLRYGLLLGGGTEALDFFAYKVTLTLSGTTTDGTQQTQTAVDGRLSGNVVPTGQAAFVADLKACIHPTFGYRLEELCMHHQVTRSFGVTIEGDVIVLSEAGLQQLNNVARITGNLRFQGPPEDPITTTDLRELAQLTEVGGLLSIVGLPNLTSLNGLRALTKVQFLQLGDNPLLTDLTGLAGLDSLSTLDIGGNPALASLAGLEGITSLSFLRLNLCPALANIGLPGLRSVDRLNLLDLPLMQSLQSLRGVTITGEVSIARMNGLTSLAGLNAVAPTLTGQVLVAQNPLLTDLAALANLTEARSVSIRENPLLPDLHELAALTATTTGVQISGAGLTSLAGLSHLQTGPVQILLGDLPLITSVSLPSLTDATAGGTVLIGGRCPAGRHIPVSLPVLARAGFATFGGTVDCTMSVSAPALATVTGQINIGNGVNSLSLPSSMTVPTFSVAATSLTTLTVPRLNASTLQITNNSSLSALRGGGGRVTTQLAITFNSALSTLDAIDWAENFDHTDAQVLINGNLVP